VIVIDVSDRTIRRTKSRGAPTYIDLTRHHMARAAELRMVTAVLQAVVLAMIAVAVVFELQVTAIVLVGGLAGERILSARDEHRNARVIRRDLA